MSTDFSSFNDAVMSRGLGANGAQATIPNAPQRFALGGTVFDELRFEVPGDLELSYRTLGGVVDIPQTNGKPAQRVSQTLGVVPETIKFEAWFVGPDADDRARSIEAMQQAQRIVAFQFGGRSFDVVIFRMTEKFRSIGEIAYAVELEPHVYRSTSTPAAGSSATASLQQNLDAISTTDLSFFDADDADFAWPSSVTTAQSAASTTKVASASFSDLTSLTATFSQALTDLNAFTSARSGLTGNASMTAYLGGASLQGLLSSAIATLGTFTGATTRPTMPVNGLSAYELAVRYTGDIANADVLMQANGITDPFNIGVPKIVIPGLLLNP